MGRVVGLGKGCATLGASERHSTLGGEGPQLLFAQPAADTLENHFVCLPLSAFLLPTSCSLASSRLSPSTLSL